MRRKFVHWLLVQVAIFSDIIFQFGKYDDKTLTIQPIISVEPTENLRSQRVAALPLHIETVPPVGPRTHVQESKYSSGSW